MSIPHAAQSFIERMGLHFENDGLPRIAGRIKAFLLLSDAPASLEELADKLQVSKASTSTNCRLLERWGFVERTSLPGDRRDYYRIAPDVFFRSLDVVRKQMEEFNRILEETSEELPPSYEVGRRRIDRMHAFHSFLVKELEAINVRWAERELEAADAADEDTRASVERAEAELEQAKKRGRGR
jgi:DNA-binding transcriptional regulator GbsR (MarR family)